MHSLLDLSLVDFNDVKDIRATFNALERLRYALSESDLSEYQRALTQSLLYSHTNRFIKAAIELSNRVFRGI